MFLIINVQPTCNPPLSDNCQFNFKIYSFTASTLLLKKHDKCAAVSNVLVFAGSPGHNTDTSEEKDEANQCLPQGESTVDR